MDDELRMKLADLGSPEALAACIVDDYPNIEIPIPLERIAYAVGIVDLIPQTTNSFEGVLVTDDAKSSGSIAYNEASGVERRRFTIAHEIGHFLIPWHGANAQCAVADMGVLRSKDTRKSTEAEANRFAAALLTPTTLFKRDIAGLGPPETEHLVALGRKYRVSKEYQQGGRAAARVAVRAGSERAWSSIGVERNRNRDLVFRGSTHGRKDCLRAISRATGRPSSDDANHR
jgi:Zn-dependent peptidase ImmA (M78 family)